MRAKLTGPSTPATALPEIQLEPVVEYRNLRVLLWSGPFLYASRGYELLRMDTRSSNLQWTSVGHAQTASWRKVTSSFRLTARLCRDGLHALASLGDDNLGQATLVAAIPGAIVRHQADDPVLRTTHAILRGTRPLHIAVTPQGTLYWGEYFDNAEHGEVHIYASLDRGRTWIIAYTFPPKAIRHVHNIVYDQWDDCLWILTGDYGMECRILRASCDLRYAEQVVAGNQQARAVALLPTADALYFSSDTPLESNHVYRMWRVGGAIEKVADLNGSSIYGCRAGNSLFFSTMVEPGKVNPERESCLYGSVNGSDWRRLMLCRKDRWPMGLFQYGNMVLPDGPAPAGLLAFSTIAVESRDMATTLCRI